LLRFFLRHTADGDVGVPREDETTDNTDFHGFRAEFCLEKANLTGNLMIPLFFYVTLPTGTSAFPGGETAVVVALILLVEVN
jgi:hypothetical protein